MGFKARVKEWIVKLGFAVEGVRKQEHKLDDVCDNIIVMVPLI